MQPGRSAPSGSPAAPPTPDGDATPRRPDEDAISLAHGLFDLARAGQTEDLMAYLRAGVPVELTDPHGNTLLMLAAYHCHAGTVAALIEHGADPNCINDRAQTPLAGAVFKKAYDVVDVLRDAGADPDLGSPSARQTVAFFGVEVVLE